LEKAVSFRALHEGETFVIPNPWDAGSARVMEALGFKALATTSRRVCLHPGPP
jgi:2-methylisocitrate lyase-like PEP mutase family enzyme